MNQLQDKLDEISEIERRLRDKIKTGILSKHMDVETAELDSGKKNFTRLSERYKYDDSKLTQIVSDWLDYLTMIEDSIDKREGIKFDLKYQDRYWMALDELNIKMQEIEKRFKKLLGDEYIDFREAISLD